jgi:hypothetical protein
MEQVKTEYDCEVVDPASCASEEGKPSQGLSEDKLILVVLAGTSILIIGVLTAFFIKRRRSQKNQNPIIIE